MSAFTILRAWPGWTRSSRVEVVNRTLGHVQESSGAVAAPPSSARPRRSCRRIWYLRRRPDLIFLARAPFRLILAAFECWRRPLEVRSKRSARPRVRRVVPEELPLVRVRVAVLGHPRRAREEVRVPAPDPVAAAADTVRRHSSRARVPSPARRPLGLSRRHPRRRRDPRGTSTSRSRPVHGPSTFRRVAPPRNIHAAAAAAPRPVHGPSTSARPVTDDPRRGRSVAASCSRRASDAGVGTASCPATAPGRRRRRRAWTRRAAPTCCPPSTRRSSRR